MIEVCMKCAEGLMNAADVMQKQAATFDEGGDIIEAIIAATGSDSKEPLAHARAWADIVRNQGLITMALAKVIAMLTRLTGENDAHPFDPTLN